MQIGFNVLLFVLLFLQGCGGGIQITEKPPAIDDPTQYELIAAEHKALAVINNIHLEIGGIEKAPSDTLALRVRGKLSQTNLFHEILFNNPYIGITHIKFSLIIKEAEIKFPPIGERLMSGFTLGLIPLEGEYQSEMILKVERSDGVRKEYMAKGSGTSSAFFGVHNYHKVMDDLFQAINSANLNSLMAQLRKDAEFFRVRSIDMTPPNEQPTL